MTVWVLTFEIRDTSTELFDDEGEVVCDLLDYTIAVCTSPDRAKAIAESLLIGEWQWIGDIDTVLEMRGAFELNSSFRYPAEGISFVSIRAHELDEAAERLLAPTGSAS